MLILAAHCLFAPPDGWNIADPKMPSQRAIVSFVEENKHQFCPSLNLTHEKVQVPIKDYLAIVERNCIAKKQKWRSLGKIKTQSGMAELTEIEAITAYGDVRIFQAILYKNKDIFILTASALKKDFGKFAASLEKTIRSMRVVDDLFSLASNETSLREAWQKKREGLESESFNEMVLKAGKELGVVWQLQVLKE